MWLLALSLKSSWFFIFFFQFTTQCLIQVHIHIFSVCLYYNTILDNSPPDDWSSLPPLLKPALTFFFSSFSTSLPTCPKQSVPSVVSLFRAFLEEFEEGWWEWSRSCPLVRLAALWGGSGSLSPGWDRQSSSLPVIVWLSVGAGHYQKKPVRTQIHW